MRDSSTQNATGSAVAEADPPPAEAAGSPGGGPDEAPSRQPLVTAGDLVNLLALALPVPWLMGLGRLMGRLQASREEAVSRVVERNLATVPGCVPEEARRLARRYVEHGAVRRVLLHAASRLSLAHMQRLFALDGMEHLDRGVQGGKGVLLLLSHLNSFGGLLCVMMLRKMGYDVAVALPRADDPWGPGRIRQAVQRVTGPQPSIPESFGGFHAQFNIRPIVDRLRRNTIVVQTGDGWHSAGFVDADFLGRRLPFTTGVASIARMSGALVVPCFVTGDPPRLRFVFEAPFGVSREPGDLETKVRGYVARLEHHVLDNLVHWEHWEVENALDTMAAVRDMSLRERLKI